MAIKLNDAQYETKQVKIFNGGVAGAVHDCKIRFEKKTATDKEKAPDYKLIMTDSAGGEINKAFYYLDDNASEGRQTFFVKEMKHLANLFGVTLPNEIDSYKQLLDLTMKGCKDTCENSVLAVFVSYGTANYPKDFLQINSAFDIVQNAVEPYLDPKAIMKRPEPTKEEVAATQEWIAAKPIVETDDLPF